MHGSTALAASQDPDVSLADSIGHALLEVAGDPFMIASAAVGAVIVIVSTVSRDYSRRARTIAELHTDADAAPHTQVSPDALLRTAQRRTLALLVFAVTLVVAGARAPWLEFATGSSELPATVTAGAVAATLAHLLVGPILGAAVAQIGTGPLADDAVGHPLAGTVDGHALAPGSAIRCTGTGRAGGSTPPSDPPR